MKTQQTRQLFRRHCEQTVRIRYLLFLPAQYERGPAEWPLLLFLHGAGERGTDLTKVTKHGPPRLVQQQPDFPFIVISPQCSNGQFWTAESLLPLLDEVMSSYRVDRKRVYATGLSMGGYGVWSLAVAHPERFAAILPICGGGDVLPILLAEPKQQRAYRSLGIWAFHGAKDPVVPFRESERMVEAFREVGNPARLTIYPEGDHDSWTETYANPAVYDWLLQHRRRRAC